VLEACGVSVELALVTTASFDGQLSTESTRKKRKHTLRETKRSMMTMIPDSKTRPIVAYRTGLITIQRQPQPRAQEDQCLRVPVVPIFFSRTLGDKDCFSPIFKERDECSSNRKPGAARRLYRLHGKALAYPLGHMDLIDTTWFSCHQ
jgi:hypothetical protein